MSAGGFGERSYRRRMGARFRSFVVSYKETDLWIGVDPGSYREGIEGYAFERARAYRLALEAYGAARPEFIASLAPIAAMPQPTPIAAMRETPPIAAAMIAASAAAGVGPMAAVAGAVARFVGEDLERELGARELVVENGGDIWLLFEEPIELSVFAGASPLSERVGVAIPPSLSPLGVCTSSGTIGPSFSFGRADAAMVAARDAALADAWATAFGNMVTSEADIAPALERAKSAPGVLSLLVVKGDRMGIEGGLELRLFPEGAAES
jgi:uncharacterized protein